MSDGIWIVDTQAKTLYASQRMAELLGTTPAEMAEHLAFFYIHPADLTSAQRLFSTKERGGSDSLKLRLKRADGSSIPVTVVGSPMHDADGQFIGVVGTFRES